MLQPLFVDCANGVGAEKLRRLAQGSSKLQLELRNTGDGILNGSCGADAVQKGPLGRPALPVGFEDVPKESRYCILYQVSTSKVLDV